MPNVDAFNAFLAVPPEIPPGIPLGVKDLFDTAGLTTTYGSSIFRDHVPATTATAVSRLEAAGYGVAGKTNLHEFAYGTTSENEHYGSVLNPLDTTRVAGGSSGGSAAALAAGLCDAALGSDSGGSVRIPAACCGVVGFKPTYGLVPTDGCFPLAPSWDHVGPMARTVGDCAEMMRALVPGFPPLPAIAVDDLRVGVAWLDHADPLVRARVETAAQTFRWHRSLDLPLPGSVYPAFAREVVAVHGALYGSNRDAYGASVRAKLDDALSMSDEEAQEGLRAAEEYRERCASLWDDLDLVVTPTVVMVAPPVGDEFGFRDRMTRMTFPFNTLRVPALALPCGPAERGLPASIQLVAGPGNDALVLAAGAALGRALGRREPV